MTDYDKARMDCFNRVFAAAYERDGRCYNARDIASYAVDCFEKEFPRPDVCGERK